MKKKTLLKAAIGAGVVGASLPVLIDMLLINRKFDLPQGAKDAISGADMSDLHALRDDYMNWLENYGYEQHQLITDDGLTLNGYLMKAKEESSIYAFCVHGYRSSGKKEFCGLVQYYLKHGINVFFVDHRGAESSEGNFIGFGAYECKDCIKWLDYINNTFGPDISLILHGISMGSATVMMMTGSDDLPANVKMCVADCGYTSAWDEFTYKLGEMKVPAHPLIEIVNGINKRVGGYDFRDDTNALEAVKRSKTPTLFVHGDADAFVPTKMVYEVYDACACPDKDILVVQGADHAASYITDREAYEAKLDAFVEKFVK